MAVFMVLLHMFRLTSFRKKTFTEMADPALLITDKFHSTFDEKNNLFILRGYTNHSTIVVI